MAWICLIVVILAFYLPSLLKIAFLTSGPEFVFTWGIYRILIPFSSSWKLLVYSFGMWLVLWIITLAIDRGTKWDTLYILDSRLQSLALRQRWLYTRRPAFVRWLPIWLARIGLLVSLIYGIGVALSSFLVIFQPWSSFVEKWFVSVHTAANLFGLSLLTLIANWAFQREIAIRYRRDIERNQKRRKEEILNKAGGGVS